MSHQNQDFNLLPFSFSTMRPSIGGNLIPSSSSTWAPSFDGAQFFSDGPYSLTPSSENHTTSEGIRFYTNLKPRFKWSDDLHRRFLSAVAFLGGEQCATPKAILELLNEKDLTIHQVSSHLQIHRNHCYEQQQLLAREAAAEAARAQMAWTGNGGTQNYARQNNSVPNPVWSAPVHYQQQAGYPYGHQFYTAPPPQSLLRPQLLTPPPLLPPQQLLPPPRPSRLYIDPVGPMPPSIPPSMRVMDYSAPQPKTILFEELFRESKRELIIDVDEEEEKEASVSRMPSGSERNNPSKVPSSSTTRNEIQDDVSLDLTLSIKPSGRRSSDRFRRNA